MSAPFHADIAEAPAGGRAFWRTAKDGVRLRLALWNTQSARGTILLLPGRTEYIEKYGRVVSDLTAAGYSVATIDWRGQGYSDRLAADPALGHVARFSDYQLDVAELSAAASEASLPRPWFLIAHSLGGNIGLRALIEGLPVERAVFSAPMWGILVPTGRRLLARVLPCFARLTGKGMNYLPGSRENAYVTEVGLNDNLLTTDADHFAYLASHIGAVPQLALGGPSIHWFGEAQAECRQLARSPRPPIPVQIYLGTDEGIVEPAAFHAMHRDWQSASLTTISGARHELMMESPAIRSQFKDGALEFLGAN